MTEYDRYLDKLTDEYLTGCQPKVIGSNEDNVPDYNCEGCNEEDCEHWSDHNYLEG